jgi:spheroidene monooxygenase
MLAYAHQGAHQVASAAAYKHQFFSESLFVRMQVLQMAGVWQGRSFDSPTLTVQSTAQADAPLGGTHLAGVPSLEVSHV